ncbi:hypothetical protein AX16_006899 [Volvariella volvacea WC 439]|nr:hypothetical protein AX16_006899 [Volvariella volvacea WC 439]
MASGADASSSPSPSKLEALQAQVDLLTNLYNQVKRLRQLPVVLLHPPINDPLSPPATRFQDEYEQFTKIGETIRSEPVQAALRSAKDSLNADGTDLNTNLRRDLRKRRRPPSPESPRPFIAPPKSTNVFPEEGVIRQVQVEDLPELVRDFNRNSKLCKLHIWHKYPGMKSEKPETLRLLIPNVLIAYIHLDGGSPLRAASVVVFGSREQKPPYAQSDYLVFQSLTQHIVRMLEQEPSVSLSNLLGLVCSYEGLFVDRCTICDRILSAEGHVPPVVRKWVEGEKEGQEGRWTARHSGCR